MAMRLRVVSEHAERLGPLATKVFGIHGGTIGRAIDNEWALPDPERYLSGRHARVDFRAGVYYLVDCSSNGTYVNGAQAALGKSNEHVLKDGDYLRLGDFELLVSIDASNDFPPDESAAIAFDGINPSRSMKKSTANDIGAVLDLSELLEPSGPVNTPPGALGIDAYGGQSLLDDQGTPWHMQTRPIRAARSSAAEARTSDAGNSPPRSKSASLGDADLDSGLALVCRGAGIDADSIPSEQRAAALQLCGRLLREMAVGLLELAQANGEFRNRFRLDAAEPSEAGSVFDRGVDEALVRLLTTTTVHGSAVDAIREFTQALKSHQGATVAGMHTAFDEFFAHLDPKELAERFERGAKRGVFGSQNKARYWELYCELYTTLVQKPADGFPHLYAETFTRAFEEKLAQLPPAKRGSGREDRYSTSSSGYAAGGF